MSYARFNTFTGDVRLQSSKLVTELRSLKLSLLGLGSEAVDDDVFTPAMLAQPNTRASFTMRASGVNVHCGVDNSSRHDRDNTRLWLLDYLYLRGAFDLRALDLHLTGAYEGRVVGGGGAVTSTGTVPGHFTQFALDLVALPGNGHEFPLPDGFGDKPVDNTDFADAVPDAVSRLGSPIDMLSFATSDYKAPTGSTAEELATIDTQRLTVDRSSSPGLVTGCIPADTYLLWIARLAYVEDTITEAPNESPGFDFSQATMRLRGVYELSKP